MKKFDKSLLENCLYADRTKSVPVNKDGSNVPHNVCTYLKVLMDLPLKDVPLTRERSKSIDNIFATLDANEFILDDKDFDCLKKQIDGVGITNKYVYDTIIKFIDSAQDYKPN